MAKNKLKCKDKTLNMEYQPKITQKTVWSVRKLIYQKGQKNILWETPYSSKPSAVL